KRRLLARRQLAQADLEARVAVCAGDLAAALDDRALLGDLLANLAERGRLRRRERDLHAALEVDAEVQALERDRADAQDDRGDREDEPEPPPPRDVDPLPARDLGRGRAHEARVAE